MHVQNSSLPAPALTNAGESSLWRKTISGKGAACALVCGSFRILHPGNLYCLKQAAEKFGNVCVVIDPEKNYPAETGGLLALVRGAGAIAAPAQRKIKSVLQGLMPFTAVGCRDQEDMTELSKAVREQAAERHNIEPLENFFLADIAEAIRSGRTPLQVPASACPDASCGKGRLEKLLSELKGKKIVTVNGCFDILHSGHARLLSEARRKGDALIVLVNDDDSVKAYKGPTRPVFPARFRISVLNSLKPVTAAFPFSGNEPLEMLSLIRPAIHVKGGSFVEERVRNEKRLVERWGGRIEFVEMLGNYSTSNIIAGLNPDFLIRAEK